MPFTYRKLNEDSPMPLFELEKPGGIKTVTAMGEDVIRAYGGIPAEDVYAETQIEAPPEPEMLAWPSMITGDKTAADESSVPPAEQPVASDAPKLVPFSAATKGKEEPPEDASVETGYFPEERRLMESQGGPGGPVKVIPGKMTDVAKVVTSGVPVDPKLEKFRDTVEAEKKKAAIAESEAQTETLKEQNKLLQEQLELNKSNLQRQQQFVDDQRKAVDDAIGKINEIGANIKDMKINPNRLWENSSTGSKTLAILSVFFGGLGTSAAHGGPNQGIQLLENQIDRDIDAQKAAIQNAAGDYSRANNMLGNLLKMGYSPTQGEEALRALQKEQLKTQVELLANKALSRGTKIDLQKLWNELNEQIYNHKRNIGKEAASQVKIQYQRTPDQIIGAGRPVPPKGLPNKDSWVRIFGGKNAWAAKPKVADEANARITSVNEFVGSIREIIRKTNTPGKQWMGSTDYNDAVSLIGDAATTYNKMKQLGALDGSTLELLQDIIGKPQSWLSDRKTAQSKLKQVIKMSYDGAKRKIYPLLFKDHNLSTHLVGADKEGLEYN